MSATGRGITTGMPVKVHDSLLPLMENADKLSPHPDNPRNGDVEAIAQSMSVNGVYRPVYAQRSTGFILAGNHTYEALMSLGHSQIPTVWLDVDEQQARRILLTDNRTAELGGYDEALLMENLSMLDGDLLGTGYTLEDYETLEQTLAELAGSELDGEPDSDRAPTTGELLSIADVTVGEPVHTVHHGEVYRLGKHRLVIAKLLDEHDQWRDLLPGRVFVPYPEPYITASTLAGQSSLLLIQPNRYLAGCLLDKHVSMFGEDSLELLRGEPT